MTGGCQDSEAKTKQKQKKRGQPLNHRPALINGPTARINEDDDDDNVRCTAAVPNSFTQIIKGFRGKTDDEPLDMHARRGLQRFRVLSHKQTSIKGGGNIWRIGKLFEAAPVDILLRDGFYAHHG